MLICGLRWSAGEFWSNNREPLLLTRLRTAKKAKGRFTNSPSYPYYYGTLWRPQRVPFSFSADCVAPGFTSVAMTLVRPAVSPSK